MSSPGVGVGLCCNNHSVIWHKEGMLLWFNQNGHLDKGGKIDSGGVQ